MFKEHAWSKSRIGDPKMKTNLIENVDGIDLQIINLLQEDCRLSFNRIASKLGISVGTAFNHIKSLEKKGVLKSYAVIVDSVKLGYSLTAIILVQVEGGHLTDVEKEIANATNVIAVYDTTGDYDVVVITKFRDGVDLNAFIKNLIAIPFIKRTVTNVALSVIKEDLRIRL